MSTTRQISWLIIALCLTTQALGQHDVEVSLAEEDKCPSTVGSCRLLDCDPSRNATCDSDHKCVCPSGTCAIDGMCQAKEEVEGSGAKATDILKNIGQLLIVQLHNKTLQWLNGLVALIFGVVMIVDGVFVFKYIVVGCTFVFVYILTMSSLKLHFENDPFPDVAYNVAAIEVAAGISLAAYKGYQGIQLAIGMMIGAIGYHVLQDFAHAHGPKGFAESPYFLIVMINVCVPMGVCLFVGKQHRKMMALVSSAAGGSLLSSTFAYFIMRIAIMNRQSLNESTGLKLPSKPPYWVDFIQLITVPGSQSVGIFTASTYNPEVSGTPVCLDKWLGYLGWFIFFTIGVCVQAKCEKKALKKKSTKQSDVVATKDQEEKKKPLLADAKAAPKKAVWGVLLPCPKSFGGRGR